MKNTADGSVASRLSWCYEYSRGWARERRCFLAVESQVLSGRKHCWSNDRGRERERDREREREGGSVREREREMRVCGI